MLTLFNVGPLAEEMDHGLTHMCGSEESGRTHGGDSDCFGFGPSTASFRTTR